MSNPDFSKLLLSLSSVEVNLSKNQRDFLGTLFDFFRKEYPKMDHDLCSLISLALAFKAENEQNANTHAILPLPFQ